MAFSERLQTVVVRGSGVGLIGLVALILMTPRVELTHLSRLYVFLGVVIVLALLALLVNHPRTRALAATLTQRRCDRIALVTIPLAMAFSGALAIIDPPATTWDPYRIQLDAGVPLAQFTPGSFNYYERYPNNHPIFALARIVHSMSQNGFGTYRTIFSVIVTISFGAALVSGYLIARKLGRPALGVASIAVTTLVVGTNPNFAVPYTDALTLGTASSVVMLLLYAADARLRWALLYSELAGFICALGFLLKTTPIVNLAGAIIGLLVLAVRKSSRLLAIGSALMVAGVFLITITAAQPIVRNVAGFNELPNEGVSAQPMCYIYDGMSVTQLKADRSVTVYGGWNRWRDHRTGGRPSARQTAFCTRAVKRLLAARGVVKTAKFYVHKAEFLMGDGTFFAYGEGTDIKQPPLKQGSLAKVVDSFYGHGGSLYRAKNYLVQISWLVVLALIGVGLIRTRVTWGIFMVMLPLTGIGLFEEIFQSRARYLFSSAPLFIVLAMLVLPDALAWIQLRRKTEAEPEPAVSDD